MVQKPKKYSYQRYATRGCQVPNTYKTPVKRAFIFWQQYSQRFVLPLKYLG
jgi:hypothetical protein